MGVAFMLCCSVIGGKMGQKLIIKNTLIFKLKYIKLITTSIYDMEPQFEKKKMMAPILDC